MYENRHLEWNLPHLRYWVQLHLSNVKLPPTLSPCIMCVIQMLLSLFMALGTSWCFKIPARRSQAPLLYETLLISDQNHFQNKALAGPNGEKLLCFRAKLCWHKAGNILGKQGSRKRGKLECLSTCQFTTLAMLSSDENSLKNICLKQISAKISWQSTEWGKQFLDHHYIHVPSTTIWVIIHKVNHVSVAYSPT